jgi:hypothetical protein
MVMTGTNLAIAFLMAAGLLGGTHVQKSVGNILSNDPRALYLMAEYKMATGDSGTALRLLQRASSSPSRKPASAKVNRTPMGADQCPYSGRI